MRVALWYSNDDVRIEDRPRPEPGPGEVLMRIEASGICGSDVMEWYRLARAPIVLGHEVAGVVEEVGRGVNSVAPGDRIVASHHVPCNTCHHCLRGRDTLCDTLRTTTFDPGGFAEWVRLPAINVDRGIYPIPGGMGFDAASFAEPLACVLRARRIAGMPPGHSVLVLGAGLAGLLHVAVSAPSGSGFVAATDPVPARLDAAREMGAEAAWDAREDVAARLVETTGRLAELVIVCTAAPAALEQAFACVDRGGTVLIFALHEPGTLHPVDVHSLWKNGTRVMSSYAGNRADHLDALELIRAGRIDPLPLVTHRLPLDRTGEGIRLVAAAGDALKVIVHPHGGEDPL